MIRPLTFRCTILVFILILFVQVFLLNFYFNFIPLDNVSYLNVSQNFESFKTHIGTVQQLNISCDIRDKQAISALKRMKTTKCKQNCIDTYCKVSQSKQWPNRLQSQCNHFDQVNKSQLHSCYKFDVNMLNLFPAKKSKIFNNTMKNDCIDLCLQYDFEYAGQFSSHCICINDIDIIKDSNVSCDKMCSNASFDCSNRLFVHLTGLKKVPYYFPNLISHSGDNTPRIVFLLLVNGRSFLQVNRLLRNIYSKNHYYYIHVDLRHNYLYEELFILESRFSNIKLARNRFASIWGGSSLLSTILHCINDVLNFQWNWDFIINLSETDFPIKPILELEKYLAANHGKNFIKSHGKNTYDFVQMQALNKVFIECEQHMWRIANRELIKEIVWDGGSDWVILSRNFSHYVTNSKDQILSGLKSYFQYSLLPAESFFHVVLRNSEYCSTIVNNNLRVTNWNRKKGCQCQHKNIVDWCGCSPNTFRNKDASRLVSTQSRPLFFGRKFEHVVDSDIIDFVEQSLLMNGLPLLDESVYMQNIFTQKHDNISQNSNFRLECYFNHGLHLKKFISQNCLLKKFDLDISFDRSHFDFEESNVYFKNNKFYGTLLQYKLVEGENAIARFEVIMRKYQNDTLLLPSNLKPKLRSITICSKFDVKEDIFRDFECFIDQFANIEVLSEWELFFGHYNLTFVYLDPNDKINFHSEITLNNTNSDQQFIRHLVRPTLSQYPLTQGIWKLIVLNQMNVISASKFMVTKSDKSPVENNFFTQPDTANLETNIWIENVIKAFIKQQNVFFSTSNHLFWYIEEVCFEMQSDSNKYNLFCEHSRVMSCLEAKWNSNNVKSRYLLF